MIIIPEFSEAKAEPANVELANRLQVIQSQLEVYRVQHQGQYPCGDPQNPINPDEFIFRLTTVTSKSHTSDGCSGPYLKEMPTNPINGYNTVRYGNNPGLNHAGWCFNPITGIIASDAIDQNIIS